MRHIEALVSRGEGLEETERRRREIERAMDAIVDLWKARVDQLGERALGRWSVGRETGGGYSCWTCPGETISFLQPGKDGEDSELLPIN